MSLSEGAAVASAGVAPPRRQFFLADSDESRELGACRLQLPQRRMPRILERGDLFVFYRPCVGREQVEGIDDVQRLYLVMRPNDRHIYRRLVVGRKRLPSPRAREKHWVFVDRVTHNPGRLIEDFQPRRYTTKTRGERIQPGTRPAGEGAYAIVGHEDHVHVAYRIDTPTELGDVQRELGIEALASYIVTVRNPDRSAKRRFVALAPAHLDHVGSDMIWIAGESATGLDAAVETQHVEEILHELSIDDHDHPTEPLFEGIWA